MRDERARLVLAAGERDLELAAEVHRVRVAEQVERDGLGVGRDVERFGVADAGQRAGGDVADAVAARFARRDADGREPAEDLRRVVDVDEVELDVLPRRDVADVVGILLGQVRQHAHLLGVHAAERDLDAQHARGVEERLGALGQRAG